MKYSTLVAVSALAASAFAAQAGDMYRAPAVGGYKDGPAYVAVDWTGFYAGVNAGYATGSWTGDPTYNGGGPVGIPGGQHVDGDGSFGGGQIGYNKQMRSIVLGIEADIEGADFSGKGRFNTTGITFGAPPQPSFTKTYDMNMDYFGTVRARVGYAIGQFLPYVTGGLAYGHAHLNNTVINNFPPAQVSATGSADQTHVGWTAGAGVEMALSPSWSVKAEWLYVDLGTEDYHITGTVTPAFGGRPFTTDGYRSDLSFNTFKAGINYHVGQGYEPLK